MGTEIVLTQIAGPGFHVANLRSRPSRHSNPRANRLGVARGAAEVNEQRVRAIPAVVAQQLDVLAVVGDEKVEVAVVVDVADRETASDSFGGEGRTRVAADLDET